MSILTFCAACTIISDTNVTNVITTQNGLLQGQYSITEGQNLTYHEFLGIPYAEAPVGNLRFEPPVAKKNWTGVLKARKQGSICVQGIPVQGSEDCLFINVFVPNIPKLGHILLPVMFYIYGGAFERGSSNQNVYSPDYLIEKGVIVVTFNYRLGIFGFLSTGDLVAPGNAGLKDQVLALKWVKANIRQFGGDPRKITIFGESAGAASVSYHVQSPLSRGLFQRAIMESGVTLSIWALSRNVPEITKKIGQDLLIDTSTSRVLVDKLKKIDYMFLQLSYQFNVIIHYLFNDVRRGLAFGPVMEPEHDGAFFTKKSHEVLSKGFYSKVPFIVGFNSFEANIALGLLSGPFSLFLFLRYDLKNTNLIPVDLNVDRNKANAVALKIKQYYFGNSSLAHSRSRVLRFISDDQFVRPTVESVRLLSKLRPVYFYRFSYEGGLSDNQNRPYPGVAHAEELSYIWRSSHLASEQDRITRKRMTTFWTNFAKTGNPTPQSSSNEIIWKRSDKNLTYLDIGTNLTLNQFPEEEAMEFWDEIYHNYGNPPYDTY